MIDRNDDASQAIKTKVVEVLETAEKEAPNWSVRRRKYLGVG